MSLLDDGARMLARARDRARDGVEQLAAESIDLARLRAVRFPAGTLLTDPVTGQRGTVEHTSFAHVIAAPSEG